MFSEECLYEYTKYFEIIIMNVTSKNKSSKNEKKIKAKYIGKINNNNKKIKIKKEKYKEKTRGYALNHYRNLSEKEKVRKKLS